MKRFNKVLTSFAAAGCVLALSACGGEEKKPAPQPPQVGAVTVQSGIVPVSYEYPGRVAGYKDTEVRARVGGILLKRNYNEGAFVEEGQVLFQIDPSDYEAEYARQKALLAQAKANYLQSVQDAERAEALWKKKYQSTAYRDQMIAKRDANEAAVQQAEAQLKQAGLNLQYTKVTAPISGLTSREHVSEGSLISTSTSANLLTTITQTDPVYVNFSYTGEDAQAIRNLMEEMKDHNEELGSLKVKIRFGDGSTYDKLGVVDFTSSVIDQNTGSLGVRAIVNNPKGRLVPGQFVRLSLQGLVVNNAITIPEQALMQQSGGQFVYVVNDQGQIDKRSVVASRQLKNRDWLLKRGQEVEQSQGESFVQPDQKRPEKEVFVGLRDGEKVITEGQFQISNAITSLPEGVKLKVKVASLDGKNVASAAEQPKQQ